MTAGEVIRHRNDQGEANGDKDRGREGQICPQGIGTPGTGGESGVERLRGQLRDTAQYGQRDEFGGDTLEDTCNGWFPPWDPRCGASIERQETGTEKREVPSTK